MPEPKPIPPFADERTAFESLMRAHYARLCDFTFHLVRSREVAEDIVQDIFTQLWSNRESLEMRDPLRYLYRAARNRVINHRRRQGVREGWQQYVLLTTDEASDSGYAEAAVEATDLATAYARALEDLPERCRLVFVLSREQGLAYPEIARALGISVKTVETQIGRALKLLRIRLRPYLCLALVALSGGRLFG